MKVGVVTFPGSLDDVDARRAVGLGGHEAVALWHGDEDLGGVDAIVLLGGFSYGDYLRCGAISRFAPVMTSVVAVQQWAFSCQSMTSPQEQYSEQSKTRRQLSSVQPTTRASTWPWQWWSLL